jgi:thiol-disulfide isomerase/thioredoxin
MKLLKFRQDSCPQCDILDNFLKFGAEVEVDEVINLTTDGEDAKDLANMYGVMKTPTLVLIDDKGIVVDTFSGTNPPASMEILAKRGLV